MNWWEQETALAAYEEISGLLRGLCVRLADRLGSMDLTIAEEYVDANEVGLALEHLADQLAEYDLPVSQDERTDMLALAHAMGNVDRVAGALAWCSVR